MEASGHHPCDTSTRSTEGAGCSLLAGGSGQFSSTAGEAEPVLLGCPEPHSTAQSHRDEWGGLLQHSGVFALQSSLCSLLHWGPVPVLFQLVTLHIQSLKNRKASWCFSKEAASDFRWSSINKQRKIDLLGFISLNASRYKILEATSTQSYRAILSLHGVRMLTGSRDTMGFRCTETELTWSVYTSGGTILLKKSEHTAPACR